MKGTGEKMDTINGTANGKVEEIVEGITKFFTEVMPPSESPIYFRLYQYMQPVLLAYEEMITTLATIADMEPLHKERIMPVLNRANTDLAKFENIERLSFNPEPMIEDRIPDAVAGRFEVYNGKRAD